LKPLEGGNVKKEITICFRTSNDLRKPLEDVAREERRSLSALIQNVLHDYVNQKKNLPSGKERRRHPRKEVSLPAFASLEGSEGAQPIVIQDISLGGLRLSLAEAEKSFNQKTPMSIFFALPEQKSPVTIRCEPSRIRDAKGEVEVGATFADCDFPTYQKLQNYLLH
jgi:hypothetical protein